MAEPANTDAFALEPISVGFFLGLLVGEGHFGGDGRQAQVTLRMHTRHEDLFRWLEATFPGGRLYGPYHHGGRSYYQWMVRGPYLRDVIAPLVAAHLSRLDSHVVGRFRAMCERYGIVLDAGTPLGDPPPGAADPPPGGDDPRLRVGLAQETDGVP